MFPWIHLFQHQNIPFEEHRRKYLRSCCTRVRPIENSHCHFISGWTCAMINNLVALFNISWLRSCTACFLETDDVNAAGVVQRICKSTTLCGESFYVSGKLYRFLTSLRCLSGSLAAVYSPRSLGVDNARPLGVRRPSSLVHTNNNHSHLMPRKVTPTYVSLHLTLDLNQPFLS